MTLALTIIGAASGIGAIALLVVTYWPEISIALSIRKGG